jgi:hypothetical protein
MNAEWVLANIIVGVSGGNTPISDYYYGWTPSARYNGGHADMPIYPHAGGLGVVGIGSDSSSGPFSPTRGATIFAHEVTHDLDVLHTNTADGCSSNDSGADFPYASSNIQDVGFDPIDGTVYDPANTHDVMSYCPVGTKNGWVSPFTWEKVWPEIAPSEVSGAAAEQAEAQRFLVVTGRVGIAYTGELLSGYALDGFDPGLEVDPGDYRIDLEDGAGQTLSSHSFGLVFRAYSVQGAPELDTAMFTRVLPMAAGAVNAALYHEGDPTPLDVMPINSSAPGVEFKEFFRGELIESPTLVEWQDMDGGNVGRRYSLFFKREAGGTMVPLVLDTLDREFLVNPDAFPSSQTARFVLVADDSLNSTQIESATFAVPGHGPTATISGPGDQSFFDARDAIILDGKGNDVDDGVLDGASLSWSSDSDGLLGTGGVLALQPSADAALAAGRHVITLTATDSDGNQARDQIQIAIGSMPNAQPGDSDGDNSVGISDLVALLPHLGSQVGDARYSLDADPNADGSVDVLDMVYIAIRLQP